MIKPKRLLKYLFISIIMMTGSSTFSQEKLLEDKIIKMIEVMGSNKNVKVVLENMVEAQRDNYAGLVNDEFWELFKMEIMEDGFKDLYAFLTPIYIKHLAEDEIDAIIEFYDSEIGQNLVAKLPNILDESMKAGGEWGKNLAKNILNKIESSNELKFNTELKNCGSFKEGKFTSSLPDGTLLKYIRTKDTQIESLKDGEVKSKIEWVSDCRYKIWLLDDIDGMTYKEPLEVNIYEVNGNSYKFIAKMKGYDFYSLGEMEKVD